MSKSKTRYYHKKNKTVVEFGKNCFLQLDYFCQEPEIPKTLKIFLSYSTKDSTLFKIPQIAQILEQRPEIQDAYFWEEDMAGDMYEYMDHGIRACDVFVLFCSENAKASIPVNKEWKAADKLKKAIIPVFDNITNIQP